MGNWGEEFLEKTFKVTHEEIRAILFYQFIRETKEKSIDPLNLGYTLDRSDLINTLYKELLSPYKYSSKMLKSWVDYKSGIISQLSRMEIDKTPLTEKLADTNLFASELSSYYNLLLFVACLFEVNHYPDNSNKNNIKAILFFDTHFFAFSSLLDEYYTIIKKKVSVQEPKNIWLGVETDESIARTFEYVFKNVKNTQVFNTIFFLLIGIRILMHSLKGDKDIDTPSARLELAYICSRVFHSNKDYKNAINFSSIAMPSKYKASEWHADIEVPEGMTLTLKDDYEFYVPVVFVDEWSFYEPEKKDYFIPGGTVSKPILISYNRADFVYEEDPAIHYSADYDKFEEADQLYALRKTAEAKNTIVRTLYTLQGVTLGVLIGTIWFLGIGLLSQQLLKKKLQVLVIVMNAIATSVIGLILFEYFPWLLI